MKSYDISQEIWDRKYRYSGGDGARADKSVEDTFKRVAKACVSKDSQKAKKYDEFLDILSGFKFLPGGRIIANAGTKRAEVTMFNCFVMNTIEDSIEGIFDAVKESALTQKQGGGVGFDFSTIRPSGSPIKGCEAEASGPLSFMRVLDSTCRTIMSAGQRRGAQMGVMRCDHPDVERFITAKRDNAALQMFNLSVAITDKFMEAVKSDSPWDLVFGGKVHKTIRATDLWELVMRSTYDFAEPGFILIDRINRMNNLYYCERVCATNPCGEQPLPPYGACLLGSVNLTKFVKDPFSKKASIDYNGIVKTVRIAVRMLDNVIDLSNYPLKAQRAEAMAKRRMGIGITGLADMLIFLGVKYGSPESMEIAGKVMETIKLASYEESVRLASERGSFKLFDAAKYCEGEFVAGLPASLRKDIAKHGIRNSHLTSIAPTGTISLFAGNISSGLEPVFEFKYTRRIREGHGDGTTSVDVVDYAYAKYLEKFKGKTDALPECFVSASSVTPEGHLGIQAALQKHVDSSISKTINVPGDYPYEDFKGIYMKAYELGLKGCTTFRPSQHMSGVLVKEEAAATAPAESADVVSTPKRPKELEGTTYKIKTPLSGDALYVTINDLVEDNGRRRPYELFINTKNLQHFSWIVAMTRLISSVFRHDPAPRFLVEELKSIYDPNGGYFSDGAYMPSLVADIGRVIEKHLAKIGIIEDPANGHAVPVAPEQPSEIAQPQDAAQSSSPYSICPFCNERRMVAQENCVKCLACGYSKCG